MKDFYFFKVRWLLLFCVIIIGYGASAVTPQKLQVSYVTNPATANGVYVKQSGTMGTSGLEYWKHETQNYYLYCDDYSGTYYWNLDNNTNDDDDVLFYGNMISSNNLSYVQTNYPSPHLVNTVGNSNWVGSLGTGTAGLTNGVNTETAITIIEYVAATAPTVTTAAVSSISTTTATGSGNITSLGSSNPTAYGVCWSTSTNPTTSNSVVNNGTATTTGAFTAAITALNPGTTYYVRAYATNTAGTSYGSEVSFVTLTPNSAPTDISLSATSVNENVAGNTTIGTLSSTDPDAGNTFTYTLVAGDGSTDNASFNISGSSLRISSSPDYETKSSYSVRVRTTDQGSLTYEEAFTITINNLNETPTDISLSSSSVNENVIANTTIGTLSTTDPDAGNTFTYTLVAGDGSTDNASFNISGSSLRISSSPDYEVKNIYSMRIRTTDQSGLWYEEALTVTISNVNESPTNISLSLASVSENVAGNTTIGTLSTTDPDAGNTFTYTLVAGDGSTDNASFNISGSSLRISSSPDYETKSSYSVRVRSTDQGSLLYEKSFTITITDLSEAPTNITLSSTAIVENVAAGSAVGTLAAIDDDTDETSTFILVAGEGSTDNASFTITGDVLSINDSPNFEAKNSYSVRIRVTDKVSLYFEKAFTITIANVNEAPLINSMQSFSIAENLAVGAVVGKVLATDTDAGTTFSNWTITLNVDPNGNGTPAFAIDAVTGFITVADAGDFDREVTESVNIEVTVSDGSLTSAEENVQINITDVNDVAPVIVANQKLYVEEQSPNGTTVGTVSATDADFTPTVFQSWTITAGNGDGYFAINTSTGVITVVDNSGLDPEVNPSFTLTLTVSDGENVSIGANITIIVSGINNDSPSITPGQVFTIDENSAVGTFVGSVLATDPDFGTNFQGWAILSGNISNAFTIDTDGKLYVNEPSALDYETITSFTLNIQVSDGLHQGEGTVTVNINNVVETAITYTPIVELSVYPNPVSNRIFFKFDDEECANYTMDIISISGIKILDKRLDAKIGNEGISVQNLAKGAYYLRIITPVKVYSKLFIKM